VEGKHHEINHETQPSTPYNGEGWNSSTRESNIYHGKLEVEIVGDRKSWLNLSRVLRHSLEEKPETVAKRKGKAGGPTECQTAGRRDLGRGEVGARRGVKVARELSAP